MSSQWGSILGVHHLFIPRDQHTHTEFVSRPTIYFCIKPLCRFNVTTLRKWRPTKKINVFHYIHGMHTIGPAKRLQKIAITLLRIQFVRVCVFDLKQRKMKVQPQRKNSTMFQALLDACSLTQEWDLLIQSIFNIYIFKQKSFKKSLQIQQQVHFVSNTNVSIRIRCSSGSVHHTFVKN